MKKIKKDSNRRYYKCPICQEDDNDFYMSKTKKEETLHARCDHCKTIFFFPKIYELNFLDFVEFLQNNGNGLTVKNTLGIKKEPALKELFCPCCLGDKTVLSLYKKGIFSFRCFSYKCKLNVFISSDYSYVFKKYKRESKKWNYQRKKN